MFLVISYTIVLVLLFPRNYFNTAHSYLIIIKEIYHNINTSLIECGLKFLFLLSKVKRLIFKLNLYKIFVYIFLPEF